MSWSEEFFNGFRMIPSKTVPLVLQINSSSKITGEVAYLRYVMPVTDLRI